VELYKRIYTIRNIAAMIVVAFAVPYVLHILATANFGGIWTARKTASSTVTNGRNTFSRVHYSRYGKRCLQVETG
jgi:hypothetical protein